MVVVSFCCLCLALAVGKLARVHVPLLQKLYLPSSVIGGLIALLVVQIGGELIPPACTAGWSRLPGLLINVVFATLFLGVTVPPLATVWDRCAPQLCYGQIVAWGQYVVGLGLTLFLLGPVFGVPALFGVVIPVGFEGGHGTAGGLRDTFVQLDWQAGADFGLASATAGMVAAIVVGFALINWAARRGYVSHLRDMSTLSDEERAGFLPEGQRPSAGLQTTSPDSVDSLALHLAVIGIAILIGYLIKQLLVTVEGAVPALNALGIFSGFPLFPLAMIGGLATQAGINAASRTVPVDHGLMQRLGGAALDFLVVAAIATIRVEAIASQWLPFVIIVVGGILWNVFCVVWLARRLLPDAWFERAIAEMGQSMGVTATGLLLLRSVDAEQRTAAPAAFAYKQLLHEPFMGGGLWTSAAVLLVARQGAPAVLGISVGAICIWLVVWAVALRPKHAAP